VLAGLFKVSIGQAQYFWNGPATRTGPLKLRSAKSRIYPIQSMFLALHGKKAIVYIWIATPYIAVDYTIPEHGGCKLPAWHSFKNTKIHCSFVTSSLWLQSRHVTKQSLHIPHAWLANTHPDRGFSTWNSDKLTWMWRCATGWMVPDIAKDYTAFTFRVKQYTKSSWPWIKGTTILKNVGIHTPTNTV
jgi:hypothetical protein